MNKKITLLLIFSLYLLTRLYHLTILPIFNDETTYIYLAKIVAESGQQLFYSLIFGKPPPLIWLTSPVLKFSPPTEYLFYSRMVTVLAGLASLLGLYKLSYLLFNSAKIALLSMCLYILLPFTLFHDRLFLYDSPLLAASVFAVHFAVKTARTFALRDCLLWGIFLGLAYLLKPTATIIWLLTPLVFLITKTRKTSSGKLVTLIAISLGISQLMNNLLRFSYGFQFYEKLTRSYFLFDPATTISNLKSSLSWMVSYYTFPVFVMGCAGLFWLIWKKRALGTSLLLLCLVPILAFSLVAKIYFPRYILFTAPFFILAACFFLSSLQKRNRPLTFVFCLLAFLPIVRFDTLLITDPPSAPLPEIEHWQYISGTPSGYGLQEIFHAISRESQQKKVTLAISGTISNFPYAFNLEFWDNPHVTLITDWNEQIDDPILKTATNSTVLVAIKNRRTNFHPDIISDLSLQTVIEGTKPGGQESFYLARLP